jgi:very-short-patch-repair endonuclease
MDSALRDGQSRTSLLLACPALARTGRNRAYRVVEAGSPLAANPFESVVRAVLEDVPGAQFRPQVWVGNVGRADLVDKVHHMVVECDSFEFHSDAEALNNDMERYNAFVCEEHLVLRFGWKHAMFQQNYVCATVGALVAAQERSVGRCPHCRAA